MKLLTSQNMRAFLSITASSAAVGFPVANLAQLDPDLIWVAGSFSADVSIVIDLGAALPVNQIWLNNANFTAATIQANSSNSWDSPAVSKAVTLDEDDIGVFKGFFELSTADYRYVRILIPIQALLFGDTLPSLGNVIIGSSSEQLSIAAWQPRVKHDYHSFQADSGSFTKAEKGKARHVFTAKITATKAEIDAAPLKRWAHAVLYADFGSVADSYLIYPPAGREPIVRSQIDCEVSFTLEELV